MKLKLIKLLAWTGLLGLFAAGTSSCAFKSETVGKFEPDSAVLLDGEIACPAQDDEVDEEQELAPVPADESEKDSKQ